MSRLKIKPQRMLFKVQRSITGNPNNVLVYDKRRKYMIEHEWPTTQIEAFFTHGKLKVYVYGTIKGKNINLENEHQPNPGW